MFIRMDNWKKLTLKKRRVEEGEQSRKVTYRKTSEFSEAKFSVDKQSFSGRENTSNYAEPIKRNTLPSAEHRADNKFDEAKGQSERILKSMALASLRKTGGYRSIFADRVEAVDQADGYRNLPKSCFQCKLLQLGPVITIENGENEQHGGSFLCSTYLADQILQEEKKKKPEETGAFSIMKENQENLLQNKNNKPLTLEFEDRRQNGPKTVNRRMTNESFFSSVYPTRKEHEKNFAALNCEKSVEQTENKKQLLLSNGNFQDAGISDVDFDSEMDVMFLDIPKNGLVEESCFFNKHKKTVRETLANMQNDEAFEIQDGISSKTNAESSLFSPPAECSTAEKDGMHIEERSKTSMGITEMAKSRKMGKSSPFMGNKVTRDNMPTLSKEKTFRNRKQNRPGNLNTPQPAAQFSYDLSGNDDGDDDVIITKEIRNGKETIYGKNHSFKDGKYDSKMVTDSRCVNKKRPHTSWDAFEKRSKTKEKAHRFSDTMKKNSEKQLKDDNGNCPVCLMRFPQGWTSDEKDHHVSECLAEDMFTDQNEDIFTEIQS